MHLDAERHRPVLLQLVHAAATQSVRGADPNSLASLQLLTEIAQAVESAPATDSTEAAEARKAEAERTVQTACDAAVEAFKARLPPGALDTLASGDGAATGAPVLAGEPDAGGEG